jgi:hypothetical protein
LNRIIYDLQDDQLLQDSSTMFEILNYTDLLENEPVNAYFIRKLLLLKEKNVTIIPENQMWPGVYLLLMHYDARIRWVLTFFLLFTNPELGLTKWYKIYR